MTSAAESPENDGHGLRGAGDTAAASNEQQISSPSGARAGLMPSARPGPLFFLGRFALRPQFLYSPERSGEASPVLISLESIK